jgi:ATP-dependent RNA helicase
MSTTSHFVSAETILAFDDFEDMGLKEDLLRGIFSYGFERPSAIQRRAIYPIISGRNAVCQAQSGTGKTGTFAISALQLVQPASSKTQVLILSPTRDLALQTQRVVSALGSYLKVTCHACIGGRQVQSDVKAIATGAHVVSGTPGRVLELMRQAQLSTKHLKLVVVDEADEMLSKGFKSKLEDLFQRLPKECQIALFSATLPKETVELAATFIPDAVSILVRRENLSLAGIRQYYMSVRPDRKYQSLIALYDSLTITQSVVFVNTRRECEELAQRLRKACFEVEAVHGDLDQTKREEVMQRFASGRSRLLVATDVWARGLDVQQVALVINFDPAPDKEIYLHRIGRSGRFGRRGVAITFVAGIGEIKALQEIERAYGVAIEEVPEDLERLL